MCIGGKKKKTAAPGAAPAAPGAASAAPGAAGAAQAAQPTPAAAAQMSEIADNTKKGRQSGSAGGKTMLTGALGVLGNAATKKKTLLGQ